MVVANTVGPGAPRRAALACALVAALLPLACRPQPLTIPGKARDPREMPGTTGNRAPARPEPAVASKRVSSKEAPATLVAEDGSRCIVTEGQYRDTRVGDTAWCAWRTNDRAP
jgi:hypothetical protein